MSEAKTARRAAEALRLREKRRKWERVKALRDYLHVDARLRPTWPPQTKPKDMQASG